MVRLGGILRWLIPSLLWMASSCAINQRKEPKLPEDRKSTRSSDSTVVVTTGSTRGRQLYDRYCEDCHNDFEKTTRRGVSTDAILNAIDRIPEMADLDRLKISELNAIAEALK